MSLCSGIHTQVAGLGSRVANRRAANFQPQEGLHVAVQLPLALGKCSAAPANSALERNGRHHGCRDADANDSAPRAALLRMSRRGAAVRVALCPHMRYDHACGRVIS